MLDTNILLRWAQSTHPMHALVSQALALIQQRQVPVFISPQNLIEFWNVAIRPLDRNGFGMTPAQASAEVLQLEQIFPLLADSADIYPQWKALVESVGGSGVQVHDARLVAVMNVHALSHLLTLNVVDFKRYSTITVVHPLTLING